MVVYINNAYSEPLQQGDRAIKSIVDKVESLGHTVLDKYSSFQKDATEFGDNEYMCWARQKRREAIQNCDAVITVIDGVMTNEDAMIGLGMAIAMKKGIYIFKETKKKYIVRTKYPINLLIYTDIPENLWEDHYFTSVDKIKL